MRELAKRIETILHQMKDTGLASHAQIAELQRVANELKQLEPADPVAAEPVYVGADFAQQPETSEAL